MQTITFTHGVTKEVESIHLNETGDTLFVGTGHDHDAYGLYDIKSIMPDMSIPYKDRPKAPTQLQKDIMKHLQDYVLDKKHSTAAAAVVLKRADGDFWLFGLSGEIMHNPEALLIIKL